VMFSMAVTMVVPFGSVFTRVKTGLMTPPKRRSGILDNSSIGGCILGGDILILFINPHLQDVH